MCSFLNSTFSDFTSFSAVEKFGIGIVQTFITFPSLVGNIWMMLTLSRNPKLRKINLFMLNLTACEFIATASTYWMPILNAFCGKWIFGEIGIIYSGLVSGWMALAAILSFAAIAIERFLVIWQPFWKCRLTVKRKLIGVWLIWTLAFCLAFPPVIGWGRYVLESNGVYVCFDYLTQTANNFSYILFLFAGGYGLPLLIVAVCYSQIIRILRQTRKGHHRMSVIHRVVVKEELLSLTFDDIRSKISLFYSTHSPTSRNASISLTPRISYANVFKTKSGSDKRKTDVRLAKSAFGLFGVFIVCWTPYATEALMIQFFPNIYIYPTVSVACVIFAKLSVLLHPICYRLMDHRQIQNSCLHGIRTPEFQERIRTNCQYEANLEEARAKMRCLIEAKKLNGSPV